ncbi:MAG TPA: hypothetical protein VMV98_08935 [Acidobacteriaceae bacterium]|nr:hypothetical protein [Acidobacteriaceae bacterium]
MDRLELRGRLQEANSKYDELNTLASADVSLANRLLEPFAKYIEEDLTRLEMAKITAIVTRLNGTIDGMIEQKRIIGRLKEELGE